MDRILFQSEDVMIHLIFPEMERLLKRILGCILPISTIREASQDLSKLKVNSSPMLDDEDINLGAQVRSFIEINLEDGSLADDTVNIFYRLVDLKQTVLFPVIV